jgi:hypothetical protein
MYLVAIKPQRRYTQGQDRVSNEALRVLASLIAQFHLKKITGSKKPDIRSDDLKSGKNG